MPENFWDAEKNAPKEKEFGEHIAGLEKLKTDSDARHAAVPAKAEDYKIDLGDVKLPDGVEIDQKNPMFLELRDQAHKAGWTGEEFGKVLQTYAKKILAERAQNVDETRARIEARNTGLGENGAKRAADLETWIDASWEKNPAAGNEIKGLAQMSPWLTKELEDLKTYRTNQGVHGMTQTGRVEPGPNDWKPENWDKLSSVDRLVMARAHAREKTAA